MTTADKLTILVGTGLIAAWLVLFGLTLWERRYVPKHRWKPTHRA